MKQARFRGWQIASLPASATMLAQELTADGGLRVTTRSLEVVAGKFGTFKSRVRSDDGYEWLATLQMATARGEVLLAIPRVVPEDELAAQIHYVQILDRELCVFVRGAVSNAEIGKLIEDLALDLHEVY